MNHEKPKIESIIRSRLYFRGTHQQVSSREARAVLRDKTRRKGGVLICVSSNLDYKVIQEFENNQLHLQCLRMEITSPKTKGFIFYSCHRM